MMILRFKEWGLREENKHNKIHFLWNKIVVKTGTWAFKETR